MQEYLFVSWNPDSRIDSEMHMVTLLASLRSEFRHGEFEVSDCRQLRRVVLSEVPQAYGVYVIHTVGEDGRNLVYIGKAGTLKSDGKFCEQNLRGRMTNKQGGVPRAEFFAKKMANAYSNSLHFEWFAENIDGKQRFLPFFVEAQLLAAYFTENRCLPPWNLRA